MINLRDVLSGSDVIKTALGIVKKSGQKAYLVGGTIRDILINSSLGNDYDFSVQGKAFDFAKSFAEEAGGTFFILDDDRCACRVVSGKEFQADFSGLKNDIQEDLRMRDFTINSMAIPLDSLLKNDPVLLDPLGGKNDLVNRLLRAASEVSIQEDPLRILRAFRFSSRFNLTMDAGLVNQIKIHREGLKGVSEERVRSELFMILGMPGAFKTLKDMDNAGILSILFPETEEWKGFYQGGWHINDLFDHSMNAVGMAEEVLNHLDGYFHGYGKVIGDRMTEEVEDCVTRKGLVKLAALIHDSGKLHTRAMQDGRGRFLGHEDKGEEISADIAKRLKLSRRSEKMLRGLTADHMRILGLSRLKKVTPRAKYRFFRDADGYGLELLILSLADAMATPVEGNRLEELKRLIGNIAGYYFEEFIAVPPVPLVTGEDIMKLFGIPQGREIGRMVEALREAEALGRISDRKEAIEYLKRIL